MTNKNISNILSKFETVGTKEIKESEESMTGVMRAIFEKQPTTWFTQKDFVTNLNKSNPFVNKTLHRLIEQNVIRRVKSGYRFFYILKEQVTSKKSS